MRATGLGKTHIGVIHGLLRRHKIESLRRKHCAFKYFYIQIEILKYLRFKNYTGCIKKMVIELWSALARSLYNPQKLFFHSRKDQAFSFRMLPFL